MAIKVLYCIFLGALLVLFVGWAIVALYPSPQWESEYPGVPQYYVGAPVKPTAPELEILTPAERAAKLRSYESALKQYEADQKTRERLQKEFVRKTEVHDRNVSLLSLLVAVVLMALGVGLSGKMPVISEGLLLGGLFTLIYSIGWSFVRSPKIAVIPVGIGLIVTIFLGYKRFVRPQRG